MLGKTKTYCSPYPTKTTAVKSCRTIAACLPIPPEGSRVLAISERFWTESEIKKSEVVARPSHASHACLQPAYTADKISSIFGA